MEKKIRMEEAVPEAEVEREGRDWWSGLEDRENLIVDEWSEVVAGHGVTAWDNTFRVFAIAYHLSLSLSLSLSLCSGLCTLQPQNQNARRGSTGS